MRDMRASRPWLFRCVREIEPYRQATEPEPAYYEFHERVLPLAGNYPAAKESEQALLASLEGHETARAPKFWFGAEITPIRFGLGSIVHVTVTG
jgi:hypothetical protein